MEWNGMIIPILNSGSEWNEDLAFGFEKNILETELNEIFLIKIIDCVLALTL